MRLPVLLISLLLSACSPFESVSGLGRATPLPNCAERAIPWRAAAVVPRVAPATGDQALVAVTYNLHSGLGPSWTWRHQPRATVEANLRGIAEAIVEFAAGTVPDVVALNEVDFAARRSGGFDQAEFVAAELRRLTDSDFQVIAGETWRRRIPGLEARFGNALLVRHPVRTQRACLFDDAGKCSPVVSPPELPALEAGGTLNRFAREKRGLIHATLDFHGKPVDVIVTHLDAFVLGDREAQAAHLLRRFVRNDRTTLVLGDINAVPTVMTQGRAYFAADRTHDILTSGALADARMLYAAERGHADLRAWATYPATAPVWPLDAVFGSLDLAPEAVAAIGTTHSDHRGLGVRYRLSRNAAEIAAWRARHDAMRREQFAQIMRCDMTDAARYTAQVRWLIHGTGFLDIASLAERQRLQYTGAPTF